MADAAVKPIDSPGIRGAAKEAWDAQARLRQVLLQLDVAKEEKTTTEVKTSSNRSARRKK